MHPQVPINAKCFFGGAPLVSRVGRTSGLGGAFAKPSEGSRWHGGRDLTQIECYIRSGTGKQLSQKTGDRRSRNGLDHASRSLVQVCSSCCCNRRTPRFRDE